MARITPKTKQPPAPDDEMEAAGYPDADNGKTEEPAPAAPPIEEYDEAMPERFLTGGAGAAEIAEWKAAHRKAK